MENKKPIIVGVVVLVMAVTAWVMVGKFKDLKSSKNTKTPVSSETQEDIPTVSEEPVTTQGVVTDVKNDSVTLLTEKGSETINNSSSSTIYIIDEEGEPVETKITDLESGSTAKIVHSKTAVSKNATASVVIQGTVTNIADEKMSLQTETGLKIIDITSNPTVYMGEGDQVVDKQISDIKLGSEITVAYQDIDTNLLVAGIRIDKL